MTWHVGIFLPKGTSKAYNAETREVLEIKISEESATLNDILENVKKQVHGTFGCACVCLDGVYNNEERKKIIASCINFGFEKAELITKKKAGFLNAVSQFNYEPNIDDDVYVHNSETDSFELWKKTDSKFSHQIDTKHYPYSTTPNIIVYEQYSKFNVKQFPNCKCIPYYWHNCETGALVHARIIAGDTDTMKYDSNDVLQHPINIIFQQKTILSMAPNQKLPLKRSRTLEAEDKQNNVHALINDESVSFPYSEKAILTILINNNNIFELEYIPISKKAFINIDEYMEGLDYEASEKQRKSDILKKSMTFCGTYQITPAHIIDAVGIKLGNSHCYAAKTLNKFTKAMTLDDLGGTELPYFVAYDEENTKCGQIAVDRMRYYAQSTVFDIQKIIGQNYSNILLDKKWPFQIIKINKRMQYFSTIDNHMDVGSDIGIKIKSFNGEIVKYPDEVLSDLLKHICKKTENPSTVVIALPLHFNEKQKKAIFVAALLAGCKNIYFIPEAIAAATFSLPINSPVALHNYSLFLKLGSTNLSVCVLHNDGKKIRIMRADNYNDSNHENFDNLLFDYFVMKLKNDFGISDIGNKQHKLMNECQKIKKHLSILNEAVLDVENYGATREGVISISRENFKNMASNLLERIKTSITATCESSEIIQPVDIRKIFLVGAGCKMPMIKELLDNIFFIDECLEISNEDVACGASKAALLAGWKTVHLLTEPVAAVLAYFIKPTTFNHLFTKVPYEYIIVFDLGGGTFDICIFEVHYNYIALEAQSGISYLGGRNFDNLLIKYFSEKLCSEYSMVIDENKRHKLMLECQEIKHTLSLYNEASLDVSDYDITKDGFIFITRDQFENLAEELLMKINNVILETLRNFKIHTFRIAINKIVLPKTKVLQVGGGCRMPMIKKLIDQLFPEAEKCCPEHPDEVVAIGAAYYAHCFS